MKPPAVNINNFGPYRDWPQPPEPGPACCDVCGATIDPDGDSELCPRCEKRMRRAGA